MSRRTRTSTPVSTPPSPRVTRAARSRQTILATESGSSQAAAAASSQQPQLPLSDRRRGRSKRNNPSVTILISDSPCPNIAKSVRSRVRNFISSGGLVSSDEDDDDVVVVAPNARDKRNTNGQNGRRDELQPGSSVQCPHRLEIDDDQEVVQVSYEDTRKEINEFYNKTKELLENTSSLFNTHLRRREPEPRQFVTCPICLEPLQQASGQRISSTFCGHLFCTPCITNTIKTTKNCPICRANLTLSKIHPVYLNN